MNDTGDSNRPADDRLYTIGELARGTGLTVKTIRFYSDSGVITPADRTHSGYRLFDVDAFARLELVRTLRELGAGLDDVREVLRQETTLGQLAARHLALLEDQLRLLRTRRAVLRAVARQSSTTEEIKLMHKIAAMSAEERNQLIDEFWDETTAELNVNQEFIGWMRSAKPNLPEDPSTEQVQAWIELAEMISDPSFRAGVRKLNEEGAAQRDAGQEPESFSSFKETSERTQAAITKVSATRKRGLTPESPEAQQLVEEFIAEFKAVIPEVDESDTAGYRHALADRFDQHDNRMARYWELLAVINGWPAPGILSTQDSEWLVAALRAV